MMHECEFNLPPCAFATSQHNRTCVSPHPIKVGSCLPLLIELLFAFPIVRERWLWISNDGICLRIYDGFSRFRVKAKRFPKNSFSRKPAVLANRRIALRL